MYANEVEELKIMGHDYEIERGSSAYIGNPGECNFFYNLIRIANDMPQSTQSEVLLHEILEAICNRCEIEIEHRSLTQISEGLHQVLKDNKLEFYTTEKNQGNNVTKEYLKKEMKRLTKKFEDANGD